MRAPALFTADGLPLNLEKRIGKGGEGEVYSVVGDNQNVIKFYTLPDLASRQEKIEAMIRAKLFERSQLVAFPSAVVKDKNGRFVGFSMMKVSSHSPIHELYSPASRRALFPHADYRFLTRVATNVAKCIASVHQTGCVIGDINHSGILVSDKATVTLIDADSFQIVDGSKPYLCTVGVPDFTPPELHGKRLDNVVRTENHDCFGLAVLIFQLLFMGKHPFSGRYSGGEMPMARSIEEMRFAYSTTRSTGMSPPPAAPLLSELPQDLQNAFEIAFGPQGIHRRPDAATWVRACSNLESQLKKCSSNSLHYYAGHAKECPWCRMDRTQGTQLFVRANDPTRSDTLSGVFTELANVWANIEGIAGPGNVPEGPPLPVLNLKPSTSVSAIKTEILQQRTIAVALIICGGILWALIPNWAVAAAAMVAFGLFRFFANSKEKAHLLTKAQSVETLWQKALTDWRYRCDGHEFTYLKTRLASAKQELNDLPASEKQRIDYYQQNRRSEQLKGYLQGFRIRNYKISGIGPAKQATLTSYGIETAADVTPRAVLAVPGFGPTNSAPLLAWKTQIEGRFSYNPNANAQDQRMLASIKAETAAMAQSLRSELAVGASELRKTLAAVQERRRAIDPALRDLQLEREQLIVDLHALGLSMPTVRVQTPVRPPAPTIKRTVSGMSFTGTSRPSGMVAQPTSTIPLQPSKYSGISCPQCKKPMVKRQGRYGSRSWFWGCSNYPRCRGSRII
jgi:DNA-binding helix-hairpin-helix protein with protein kinase domain